MHAAPLSAALLQTPYGMSDSQVHWLIAFTALTAIAVLIQAVALGGIAVVVIKLIGTVTKLTEELKPKVYPMIDNARDLVADSVPKIKRVTTNIADTSDVYRAKVADIDSFLSDTTQKARRQSDRVDNMVSDTLTSAGQIAGHIQNAVMAPVRQATHIIQLVRGNMDRFTQMGSDAARAFSSRRTKPAPTARPTAFEGDTVYTGLEDDYHA